MVSRELVTVVLGDSIFKQWLEQELAKNGLGSPYYGCFFSGQFKVCVFGFEVVTLGVCIEGILYPLYFDFVAQQAKKDKKASQKRDHGQKQEDSQKAKKVAEKLVKRWGDFEIKLIRFAYVCRMAWARVGKIP